MLRATRSLLAHSWRAPSSVRAMASSTTTTTTTTTMRPGGAVETVTTVTTTSAAAPATVWPLSRVAPKGQPLVTLASGAVMPAVGLGTWKCEPGVVRDAVAEAIRRGYRHIDCACDYGNEKEVGEGIAIAIKEGICAREDLWVTSKLWCTYMAAEHVEPACRRTLSDLGLDYVDLYLVHFPISIKFVPFEKRYPPGWVYDDSSADPAERKMVVTDVPVRETWSAMELLKDKGLAREIGVSNHTCQTMMDMLKWCRHRPAVNQVEIHPFNAQDVFVKFCQENGIVVTGFSPLGAASYSWLDAGTQQTVLTDPTLAAIAAKHGKTVAQVCIQWQVQRGLTVVPKSANPERQSQNLSLDFKLTDEDMAAILKLDKRLRYNDPADFAKGFFGPNGYPIYA